MDDRPLFERVRIDRERWLSRAGVRPAGVIRPGPGQESVWDYPRPPRLEAERRLLRVEFAGLILAETDRGYRVLETASPPTYYFPPEDVATDHLEPESHATVCEWKGEAHYFSVRAGGRRAPHAVWCYPAPWNPFEPIAGFLAFMPAAMDACHVGDHEVTPQPGGFYGGWITPDVTGPFKGEPGTGHW